MLREIAAAALELLDDAALLVGLTLAGLVVLIGLIGEDMPHGGDDEHE